MQLSWLIATTAEAATKAPEVDDNTVLRNVYIPLVIIASTIIFYGSKRSKNMTEVCRRTTPGPPCHVVSCSTLRRAPSHK